MEESPLHHFELHTLVPLHLGALDISLNKAVFAMWIGLALVFFFFMLVVKKGVHLVPGKLQNVAEMCLEFIQGLVDEFIGPEGKKYFHFVAALFFFVFACNAIGLIPGSYTMTSQVVVTGTFAVLIFLMTLVIGFSKHGLHFFSILVPPGVPKIMVLPISKVAITTGRASVRGWPVEAFKAE